MKQKTNNNKKKHTSDTSSENKSAIVMDWTLDSGLWVAVAMAAVAGLFLLFLI